MIEAFRLSVDLLPLPARPIERTAAMMSPGFRIGKLLPLPAKSLESAASRSDLPMNRSLNNMRRASAVIFFASAASVSDIPT